MSLQQTIDAIAVRSRQKVDSYMLKHGRLSAESQRMHEIGGHCAAKAKGLEQVVQQCNDIYDPSTDRYKCLTSESRTSVQSEILELEAAIRGHPSSNVHKQRSSQWGSLQKEYSERGAYLRPFFDESDCDSKKMYCKWTGNEPQKMGSTLDLDYLDQNDAFLTCEGKRNGERVLFVPRRRAQRVKEENPDARIVNWAEAFQLYGNSAIYKSLVAGACDV